MEHVVKIDKTFFYRLQWRRRRLIEGLLQLKFNLNISDDFTMLMFFIKIEKLDYELSCSDNEHDYN